MKKIAYLFLSLFLALSVAVSNVTAQDIQPSGKSLGLDGQGNAIYQVHANGIDIGYKLIGSGKPLVMIMGLGGKMNWWPQELIEMLSKKHQLILLDNRGMGYSTANDATFSCKLFAGDVMGLLDSLGVQKANVLGFSMGSMVAQELLLEYPERFNKVIIYATTTDGSNVAKALRRKTSDDPTILRQIEAIDRWKTPLNKLPLISNPVMLIVGTSDSMVGVESSKTLASAIPGAWLVQFKNASHSLMNEKPARFATIVSTFLDIEETVDAK